MPELAALLGARLRRLGVPSPCWVLSGGSQAPGEELTHDGDAGGGCRAL